MKTKTMILGLVVAAVSLLGACSLQEDDASVSEGNLTNPATENEDDFVVLDRMGRPEISNLTIGLGRKAIEDDKTPPESEGLRTALRTDSNLGTHVRAYNAQNTFHPASGERAHAKRIIGAGIHAADRIGSNLLTGFIFKDGHDWSSKEIDVMSEILSEDALTIDISKPCSAESFFDIEREEFVKRGAQTVDGANALGEHRTCGGRTLQDDVVDDMLTLLVRKSFDFSKANRRRISDHLDLPKLGGSDPTITFPYAGAPHR